LEAPEYRTKDLFGQRSAFFLYLELLEIFLLSLNTPSLNLLPFPSFNMPVTQSPNFTLDILRVNQGDWPITEGLLFIGTHPQWPGFFNISILTRFSIADKCQRIQNFCMHQLDMHRIPFSSFPFIFSVNHLNLDTSYIPLQPYHSVLSVRYLTYLGPFAALFHQLKDHANYLFNSCHTESDTFLWAFLFQNRTLYWPIIARLTLDNPEATRLKFTYPYQTIDNFPIGRVDTPIFFPGGTLTMTPPWSFNMPNAIPPIPPPPIVLNINPFFPYVLRTPSDNHSLIPHMSLQSSSSSSYQTSSSSTSTHSTPPTSTFSSSASNFHFPSLSQNVNSLLLPTEDIIFPLSPSDQFTP
jgi:hypothetical protein